MPTGRWPVCSSVQNSWPREVARERPARRRAVQRAAGVLDRRADGDELGEVLAPLVAPDVQAHADDAVRAQLLGLLLHARHRELAGLVHRLREHGQLLVLAVAGHLQADVVDARADHEPERRNPAWRTSRNSLIERSLVKRPARFCCSRARPASGTPSVLVRVIGHGVVVLSGRRWSDAGGARRAGTAARRSGAPEGRVTVRRRRRRRSASAGSSRTAVPITCSVTIRSSRSMPMSCWTRWPRRCWLSCTPTMPSAPSSRACRRDAVHRLAAGGVEALGVVAQLLVAPGAAEHAAHRLHRLAGRRARSGRSSAATIPTGRMPALHSCQNSWPSRSVRTGPPRGAQPGRQPHGGADGDELDRRRAPSRGRPARCARRRPRRRPRSPPPRAGGRARAGGSRCRRARRVVELGGRVVEDVLPADVEDR